MAQTGYTPISLYYSTTASAVPTNTNLANGELAINITDGKLYYKDNGGTVRLLASNATSAPVLSFSAGTTGFTPSTATTGAITLAGTLATTNGGTGLTSFTSGGVVYASSSSALATGSALTFDGSTTLTLVTANATATVAKFRATNYGNLGTTYISLGTQYDDGTSRIGSVNPSGNTSQLIFETNSSTSGVWQEGMRLTSTGLGIGTSSPAVRLQTNIALNGLPATSGTTQTNGAFRISSSGTSGIIDFGPNGSSPWIQATDFTDLSQTYNLLLNPNGGNVNIGIGNLLIGTTSLRTTGYTTGVSQYAMETTGYGGAQWFTNRTDSEGSYVIIGKSGGTTVNSNTVVANGDTLGAVIWQGATGSGVASAAQVRAKVDGSTISSSSMPGRLEFYTTPSGSTTMSERLRIANNGAWGLAGANYGTSGQVLTSQGSGSPPIWATGGGGSSQWTTSGTQIYYNTGNVGIGTASPDTYADGGKNLTVLSSTAGTRAQLAIVGNQNTADEILGRINITNSNSTNTAYRVAMIDGIRGTDNNSAYLTFSTANTAGPGERMRIDQVGRVFVGTSRPTTDAQFTSFVSNGNSNGIIVGVRSQIGADVYPGPNNLAAGYFLTGGFETRFGVYASTMTTTGYGANYAGYFVQGGNATTDCSSVYAEGNQTDTNGSAVISALYGFGKSAIGVSNNGFAVGVYARTNDYVNNINIVASSDYTGGSTQTVMRIRRNGSNIGSITTTTTATAYNTSSDYRLKNSIAPMTGALAKVALLKPCTYKWNSNGSDGEGFIAHELAEVVPCAVTGVKDEIKVEPYVIEEEQFDVKITPAEYDADGNEITSAQNEKIVTKPAVMGSREVPVYQSIDTSFLVATLTAAIQEQQALIVALTARVEALEAM